MNALFLAVSYLRFHWARSLVLVVVAALILSVPIISQVLLNGSQTALTERAEKTPLVLGSRGSALDLAMNALYFSDDRANPVTMADADANARARGKFDAANPPFPAGMRGKP